MVRSDTTAADDDADDVADPDPSPIVAAPHSDTPLPAPSLGGHIHGERRRTGGDRRNGRGIRSGLGSLWRL